MLIGPWVLLEEDVRVFEAFEEDLETTLFLRKWLAFAVMRSPIPEVVEEGLGSILMLGEVSHSAGFSCLFP